MALKSANNIVDLGQYHYLYAVEFGNKRILRPESMRLVVGRSKSADIIISSTKVSRKHCEFFCSDGDWNLHNVSPEGTSVVGRDLVTVDDVKLQTGDILKIADVIMQCKFETESAKLPMRVLKLIVLIGANHCTLAAESQSLPVEPTEEIDPECMGNSIIELPTGIRLTEDVIGAKNEVIEKLTSERSYLMQELMEAKSALRKALVGKGEAELKEAQLKEQLRLTEENPLLGLGEAIENELLCSICNEMIIDATTLNCSHMFCAHCLAQWKKKSEVCPLCRSKIHHECKSRVVDSLIEKLLEHLSEDTQKRRKELIDARKASKKRGRSRRSGRQKRRRLATIELGDLISDAHEVVRIYDNYSNEANETIEIISSDDEVFEFTLW